MSAVQRNNVKETSRGSQPMIFAHGFGCDQNMWRFVSASFENDFRTILFDHVGAGGSDLSSYNSQKYSSLTGYADDLIEICRELNLTESIFVGHSVSAVIGVLAAIKAPELFSSLVLVGPSPRYINDGDYFGGFTGVEIEEMLQSLDDNFMGWSAAMAPVIMGNSDRPELGQELTNSFCRTDPDIAKAFARVTFTSDNRADLEKCTVPTTILQSEEDVIASQQVGKYVHDHMPGSEIVILNATGHCPNLSAPTEVIAAIKAHVRRNSSH